MKNLMLMIALVGTLPASTLAACNLGTISGNAESYNAQSTFSPPDANSVVQVNAKLKATGYGDFSIALSIPEVAPEFLNITLTGPGGVKTFASTRSAASSAVILTVGTGSQTKGIHVVCDK